MKRARKQGEFEKDRLMREWRRDASRLIVSALSASEAVVRVTNWSELPFRHISIHVESRGSPEEPTRVLNGTKIGLLGPGDEVVLDYSKERLTGEPIDPADADFFVEFRDYENRHWRYESWGQLSMIDAVATAIAGSPQILEEVGVLQHLRYETAAEKADRRRSDIEVWRRNQGTDPHSDD